MSTNEGNSNDTCNENPIGDLLMSSRYKNLSKRELLVVMVEKLDELKRKFASGANINASK